MPQNPDIQYIRVRHLGETTGSLYLDDLDTEENKKQPYQIPVYIPEEGFVDLPLNDRVLLSFRQGSLRSFIDGGLVSGFVIQVDGSNDVWVSPDGDDTNPGTRSAPFATIQAAHDSFIERGLTDRDIVKVIRLLPGIHLAAAHINLQTVSIRQEITFDGMLSRRESGTQIRPRLTDRPAITISPMSHASFESFIAGGGVVCTYDSEDIDYSSASLLGRERATWNPDSGRHDAFFSIRDVRLVNFGEGAVAGKPIFASIGCPDSEGNPERTAYLTFVGCRFSNFLGEGASSMLFINSTFHHFDNVDSFPLVSNQIPLVFVNAGSIQSLNSRLPEIYCKEDLSKPEAYDNSGYLGLYTNSGRPHKISAMSIYIIQGPAEYINTPKPLSISTDRSPNRVVLGGTSNHGSFGITTGTLEFSGSGSLDGTHVDVGTIEHTGTGTLNCTKSLTASGDVNITGGGTFTANGGTIKGNLTVNTPATATLNNVIVEGNITGTGTVVQNGGGSLGTIDVETYTHNALNTTKA